MSTQARALPLLLSLLLLSGAASAADWYVDAANGDDANAGTSAATAWRTISHALQTVPTPPAGETHVIHVAAGLYDLAHGESFAWPMRTGVEVVGAGSALVTIDSAGGAVMAAAVLPDGSGGGAGVLRGATLRNIGYGVHMLVLGPGGCSVTFEDVVVENAAAHVVYGEVFSTQLFLGGYVAAVLDRVRIDGAADGLYVQEWMSHGGATLIARDCDLRGIEGVAVDFARQHATTGTLTLERCRIVDNAAGAVRAYVASPAYGTIRIEDCLIARNGGHAFEGDASSLGGGGSVRRCTIVENVGAGVRTTGGFGAAVEGTILHGNGDDVDGTVYASWSDIGDGDFAGVDGNFSADPLFRDPANGDWRLVWGSPCVDAGDPNAAPGTLDLAGTQRHVDGDLDTLERVDLGAFEFRPLDAAGVAQVGQPLVLEQWGRAGGSAILYLGRNQPQPVPLATPFGEFDLDPNAFRDLGPGPTAPGPPALRLVPIPADPVYAGLTFTFQARARSGLAPQGSAYTNPLTVTIAP